MNMTHLLTVTTVLIIQASSAMAQVAYAPAAPPHAIPQMAATENYRAYYPGVPVQAAQPAYAAPRPAPAPVAGYAPQEEGKIDIMQMNSF